MTKLDMVLERVRQLPQERQEYIALEIEFMLDHNAPGGVLTPTQEAELARRLADPDKKYVSHQDAAAYFAQKHGK